MKGVVFTTLIEMVEEKFGLDMVDTLIEKSDLPSGGVYTAVGTYDHQEAVSLVTTLSGETGISAPDLLKAFGEYLFGVLIGGYPQFAEGVKDPLDFLEGVERYIHVEVRKLYPDAELPRFETERMGEGKLEMIYSSARHLEEVCEGLIRGCLGFYKSEATIERETLDDGRERFLITLNEG